MTLIKNNLGDDQSGLAYAIEPYGPDDSPVICWEAEPVRMTAEQAMATVRPPRGRPADDRDAAAEWLSQQLASGARPAAVILRDGEQRGFKAWTLRRALEQIDGDKRKGGFDDGWVWFIPEVNNEDYSDGQTRRNLAEFFGAAKPLDEITAGEANDFRRWLSGPKNEDNPTEGGQGLSENTTRKRCAIAKQMFADAVDRELIIRNPFGKMEGLSVGASKGRDYFVSTQEATKVLEACPDAQWKLLFALGRYGGLRCPSEHLGLRWGDVDWDRNRIVVRSPKTEHHEGKADRVIPLFPELRPHLQAVLDEVLADFDPKEKRLSEQPVITRYRDTNGNMRTQLCRIIRKAGLTPWPKLFQNLRSTRATELAAEFPGHVAAEWMGHSTVVAKKHYWRVTEADFDRAIQKCSRKRSRIRRQM